MGLFMPVTDPWTRALEIAADLLDPPTDPYFDHPGLWVQEYIEFPEGEHPTDYQIEVLEAIPVKKKVSARGPHGLGKTALAAWAVLWFALTRDRAGLDWKVATTASKWRQLEQFLWPEVHKWARKIRWDKLGWRGPLDERYELQALNLKLRFGRAFALASDTPAGIEGVHADQVLYIYDEAKAIDADVFDATEGAFSAAGEDTNKVAYAVANSTPGSPSGRFYDIHRRGAKYQDWWARHVTLQEAVRAGRISMDWVNQRKVQWGERSSVFQNRVLGEFAKEDENAVIPLAWVEQANERWRAIMDQVANSVDYVLPNFSSMGVDVARTGLDHTVYAFRHDLVVTELEYHTMQDTVETAGQVVKHLASKGLGEGVAIIDVNGIGAGVVDQVRNAGFNVVAFNAGNKTEMVDISGEVGFLNARAAAWWNMRELLNPANKFDVALPDDDILTGDLTAPTFKYTASGRIQVESKDDIRKRLGRSTDAADAVVQAFWPEPDTEGFVVHDEPETISRY
jgi:hypothetical protein